MVLLAILATQLARWRFISLLLLDGCTRVAMLGGNACWTVVLLVLVPQLPLVLLDKAARYLLLLCRILSS